MHDTSRSVRQIQITEPLFVFFYVLFCIVNSFKNCIKYTILHIVNQLHFFLTNRKHLIIGYSRAIEHHNCCVSRGAWIVFLKLPKLESEFSGKLWFLLFKWIILPFLKDFGTYLPMACCFWPLLSHSQDALLLWRHSVGWNRYRWRWF